MIQTMNLEYASKNGLTGVYNASRLCNTRSGKVLYGFLGYDLGNGHIGDYEEAREVHLKECSDRKWEALHEYYTNHFPNAREDPKFEELSLQAKNVEHAFFMKLRETELPIEEPEDTEDSDESETEEHAETAQIRLLHKQLRLMETYGAAIKRLKVVSSDNE